MNNNYRLRNKLSLELFYISKQLHKEINFLLHKAATAETEEKKSSFLNEAGLIERRINIINDYFKKFER